MGQDVVKLATGGVEVSFAKDLHQWQQNEECE